ncbi:4891_t:CDS:1, partial [Racocetra persica]
AARLYSLMQSNDNSLKESILVDNLDPSIEQTYTTHLETSFFNI